MKLSEAIEAFEIGNKIRRADWEPSEYVYWLKKGKKIIDEDGDEIDFTIEEGDLTSEWEVYKEPVKTYSWAEVCEGLLAGKQFRRALWRPQWYVTRDPWYGTVVFPPTDRLTVNDYQATDWVEVK